MKFILFAFHQYTKNLIFKLHILQGNPSKCQEFKKFCDCNWVGFKTMVLKTFLASNMKDQQTRAFFYMFCIKHNNNRYTFIIVFHFISCKRGQSRKETDDNRKALNRTHLSPHDFRLRNLRKFALGFSFSKIITLDSKRITT